ncbi:hypothetical protein IE81DRAFT_321049 [Ceraceosorus guamensis]|uniref:Uncharacterized protein n=1 Tax=Ceraceosorus guamensis TaxID=1522189 RepID=A0A316W476_9BASI|nr:hypothetical protein IE81DRAFT_321049 [Ceraceosorus guamensis]PWN44727.1 hypothetical protein IE81DRAFT_321049 [Ceraceosorus guamensis]
MALDAANYSLSLVPRPGQGAIVDLYQLASNANPATTASAALDPSHQHASGCSAQYTYERARTVAYAAELRDAHTSAVLSKFSTTTATLTERQRKIQLCNPDEEINVDRNAGVFNTEWKWIWQGETFSMRRETALGSPSSYMCQVVRKPDPPVAVCRYRPASKSRAGQIELYDYNLTRLEVQDRKGLEILLLSLLLSLLDAETDDNNPRPAGVPFNPPEGAIESGRPQRPDAEVLLPSALLPAPRTEYLPPAGARPPGAPPELGLQPSRNQQTTTASRPSALNVDHGRDTSGGTSISGLAVVPHTQESNEIDIGPFGDTQSYVARALHLLRTDQGGSACDLIILRAFTVDTTPRVVQVAAGVKAAWYRLAPTSKGSSNSGELYQYVRDASMDSPSPRRGSNPNSPTRAPRSRIPLNEPIKGPSGATAAQLQSYAPPEKLIVYLSKERIDEFERPGGAAVGLGPGSTGSLPSGSQAPYIPPKTGQPAPSWSASSKPHFQQSPSPSGSSPAQSPGASGKDENKRLSTGVGKLFGKLGRLKGSEH